MSSSVKPPVIVIFGITGDLSQRKLLPALYHLMTHDLLPEGTRIIGTSRRVITADELLNQVELCVLEAQNECDPVGLKKLQDALQLVQLDPTDTHDYQKLVHLLDKLDTDAKRERLMYMAIPPNAYTPIIRQLGAHKLNDQRTRLLVEKPFGHDMASAQELITTTNEHFDESQIYRVDHYLAKETAQNLLTFRLHNPIFTPLWNSDHIEKIHIRAIESIGIENRVDFYEQTGALRDIIQSHLMQLLAIVMMDQPSSNSSENIHEGKLAFLKTIAPADPDKTIRAQYEHYGNEVGNPESRTETYAQMELRSELTRWQDTRIILETGKALHEKATEVVVQFKHPHEKRRNQLRFRLQPNEGIDLDLVVKVPGFEEQMQHTELSFSYKTAFNSSGGHPDAYERVIMDAVRADQSLFASSEELLTAWEIVQPVLDSWHTDSQPLHTYPKGAEEPV
jgi:glucose-6-phosphate 1-dehydrogenase